MIIRYCLALQAKSAAAYNEIRFDEKNWDWLCSITKSKEDFQIIKITSIQNKVLTMKK